MTNRYKKYFPDLDALRFFAFLAVFTAHITHVLSPYFAGHTWLMSLFPYFQLGVLGVNFFFVLSAFLITFLIYEERSATGYFSFTKFYIRRSLRIWPLYFLIVFIGFVAIPAFKHLQGIPYIETANVWYYIFFISNVHMMYLGEPFSPVLAVLWSIAIEEQFYIVWPFLTAFFSKGRELILFVALIIGSLIFRFFHLHNGTEMYLHPFSIMSDFGIGGLLAYFCFKRKNLFVALSHMDSLVIVIGYLSFFTLIFINFQIFENPVAYVFERCIWGLFFAFIIFEQCFCTRSPFKFGRIQLLGELGKRSYGLYCYHQIGILVGLNILRYFDPYKLHLNQFILEPSIAIIVTFGLAFFSYKFYESPFLRLKSRFGF